MASGKIFINYRREDSRGDAGRLFDRLKARFPSQVFMDVSTIEPGVDFVEAIEHAVGSCDACVVVIGKHWLIDDTGRRRLEEPEDFVRLEITTALKRNVRVIPVLVSGAAMPSPEDLPEDLRPLTRRNALQITDQDWDHSVELLTGTLERVLKIASTDGGRSREGKRPTSGLWVGAASALALVALLSLAVFSSKGFLPRPSPVSAPAPGPNPTLAPTAGTKAIPIPAPVPGTKATPVPPATPTHKPNDQVKKTVGVGATAQIRGFSAPGVVTFGEPAQICYQIAGAQSARIDPEVGALNPSTLGKDCRPISPPRTTTYTLAVTSLDGGKITRSITVTVKALPPQVQIVAQKSSVGLGETTQLCWSVVRARTARIDPGVGALAPMEKGCQAVSPKETTTYTLTATGSDAQTVSRQVTVQVQAPPPPLRFAGFIGEWTNAKIPPNPDFRTNKLVGVAVTRVEIGSSGNYFSIHMWGNCYPTDCDWGEQKVDMKEIRSDGSLLIRWTYPTMPGFVRTQELVVLNDGQLMVVEPDTKRVEYFFK